MKRFLFYVDRTLDPFIFGFLFLSTIFSYNYFLILEKSFMLYIFFAFITATVIYLFIFYVLFKKRENDLDALIEQEENKKFRNSLFLKYQDMPEIIISLELFFKRYDRALQLINERFDGNSFFRGRLDSLLHDFFDVYINNLNVYFELKKEPDSETVFKTELKDIVLENDLLLKNLDVFVKEILIEKRNIKNMNDINESFLKSIELFEKIKRKG